MSNVKKHHYLIAGELTFTPPGAPEGTINTIKNNGVLMTNAKHIMMRDLGRAQQVLQLNLHHSIGEAGTVIHNVVILNLTYLGYFTQEEWKTPPEGLKVVEKQVDLTMDPETALASKNSVN